MKKLSVFVLLLMLVMSTLFAVTYEETVKETAALIYEAIGRKTSVSFVSMDSDSSSFAERFMSDVEEALMERDCIVLDRKNVDKIIQELEFQTSGLVDDKLAVSIGHMAGAQMIIVGESSNSVSSYRVEVSLIDVESTLTRRRKSFDISYDQNLRNIIGGKTSNVGNQNFSVGVRGGASIQFNKAHEDMVGTDVRPLEKSPFAIVPTVFAVVKLSETLKLQTEASYIQKNGIRVEDYSYESGGYHYHVDIDVYYSSLEVPVLLSWNFIQDPISVNAFAGGYVSIPTSTANMSVYYRYADETHGGSVDIAGMAYGVTAGFDVGFPAGPGKIVLDTRFCYDLTVTRARQELLVGEQGLMTRKYLAVSAGYVFDI